MKTYNIEQKLVEEDADAKLSASQWIELCKKFGRSEIER